MWIPTLRYTSAIMESTPKRKKQQESEGGPSPLTKTLLSAVAAIGMLSAPDHKQLTSAEIDALSTWSDGAAKLRQAAQTGTREVGAILGQFQNGTMAWMRPIVGDETSVPLGREHNTRELERAIAAADGKRPVFLCDPHTHPGNGVAAKMGRAKTNSLSAYPPSAPDIRLAAQQEKYFAESPLLKGVEIRHAVFAGQGVFYYGPTSEWRGDVSKLAPEEDKERRTLERAHDLFENKVEQKFLKFTFAELFDLYRLTRQGKTDQRDAQGILKSFGNDEKEARRVLRKVLVSIVMVGEQREFASRFVTEEERLGDKSAELQTLTQKHTQYSNEVYQRFIATTMDGTPPSKPLLAELTKAYALQGSLIRFVPYEDLHTEPPCAGVRYKPGK